MKTKTLILPLTICALSFVVDGLRYSKDESGSDRIGREYDDGNRSALSQKSDSKRSRSGSRAGKINGSDGEEKNFPEGDPPERDSDGDNEKASPGRGPHGRDSHRRYPGRGPPNFDDDDNGSGSYGRGPSRRGPPRRGPSSFDNKDYGNDGDKTDNYGNGPSRRGPPRRGPSSFDNKDYGNDGDKTDNYGNGPSRRMPDRYDNSERDGYEKTRRQRPSDSSDGQINNPASGQPGAGHNRGFNPGYGNPKNDERHGGNEKLRRG